MDFNKSPIVLFRNINFCWGPGNFGNDPDYPEKKILIILAGLNGSYKANYVLQAVVKAYQNVAIYPIFNQNILQNLH